MSVRLLPHSISLAVSGITIASLVVTNNPSSETEVDQLRSQANAGVVSANYELAQRLIQEDWKSAEAIKHFRDAARQGHAPSQFELGITLLRRISNYQESARKADVRTRAIELVNNAATAEYAPALAWLGDQHKKGKLLPRSIPDAVALYERASDAGSQHAMRQLVSYYRSKNLESKLWDATERLARSGDGPAALKMAARLFASGDDSRLDDAEFWGRMAERADAPGAAEVNAKVEEAIALRNDNQRVADQERLAHSTEQGVDHEMQTVVTTSGDRASLAGDQVGEPVTLPAMDVPGPTRSDQQAVARPASGQVVTTVSARAISSRSGWTGELGGVGQDQCLTSKEGMRRANHRIKQLVDRVDLLSNENAGLEEQLQSKTAIISDRESQLAQAQFQLNKLMAQQEDLEKLMTQTDDVVAGSAVVVKASMSHEEPAPSHGEPFGNTPVEYKGASQADELNLAGTEALSKFDFDRANDLFRQAAELGSVEAMNNIGMMHLRGKGARKSGRKAVRWFTKAAAKGSASAAFNLGYVYHHGVGIRANHRKSIQWYKTAKGLGSRSAAKVLYELGRAEYQDEVLASN